MSRDLLYNRSLTSNQQINLANYCGCEKIILPLQFRHCGGDRRRCPRGSDAFVVRTVNVRPVFVRSCVFNASGSWWLCAGLIGFNVRRLRRCKMRPAGSHATDLVVCGAGGRWRRCVWDENVTVAISPSYCHLLPLRLPSPGRRAATCWVVQLCDITGAACDVTRPSTIRPRKQMFGAAYCRCGGQHVSIIFQEYVFTFAKKSKNVT